MHTFSLPKYFVSFVPYRPAPPPPCRIGRIAFLSKCKEHIPESMNRRSKGKGGLRGEEGKRAMGAALKLTARCHGSTSMQTATAAANMWCSSTIQSSSRPPPPSPLLCDLPIVLLLRLLWLFKLWGGTGLRCRYLFATKTSH